MSVDFSNVQVGDRIKLTRANGDEFSFTVTGQDDMGGNGVESARDTHYSDEWDTLEMLEEALPEAPTRTGAMIHNGLEGTTYFVLNSSGRWLADSGWEVNRKGIQERLRQGWKVVFEGLDYDA